MFSRAASLLLLASLTAMNVTGTAVARDWTAATVADVSDALRQAQPGDTIVLTDGTWKDAALALTRGGTAAAPITVRAKTLGRVVFSGESSLTFAAPHLVVSGVKFSGGALTKGNSVVEFASDDGRLTDSAIVDYNPPD